MATAKSKNNIKNLNRSSSHVVEAAEDLYKEGKKFAHDVFQQSVNKVSGKVSNAEDLVSDYSDKVVQKIHEKPLTSVLVAAGVGMLLAAFLRK